MNGLVAWWARNPVAANLLMVGILLAGTLGFLRMDREVFPAFRLNWVQVTVTWPGAAPQEVEEQIILRVEESLTDLDNVRRLRANASEGFAEVYIEADPTIDIGDFINEVKLRVDGIPNFPTDIEPPRVSEIVQRPELLYVAVYGDVDERLLKRTTETLRDEIALLPGAALSDIVGTRNEEVSIEVSEEALQAYDLTFDDVVAAVRANSLNLSSGNVRTQTGNVQLSVRNLADTQVDFEQIVIRQTSDGAVIRVRDVATVLDAFEDFESKTQFDGVPGFLIGVRAGDRMNVVTTSEAVKEWLKTANEGLPEGIQVQMFLDDSKTYFDRIGTISRSAVIGLVLVFIVLILFLRTQVAIWVTVGIATAFAGAFVFLPGLDVSLNMLTLFAFLLVIGVVVDDAIIVGESIHSHVERGGQGVTAAIAGTQLVLKPVIFAVVTTMIAFMPWLFLTGPQVQITRQLSIIIIVALTFSLIEALLILPSHLSKMKRKGTFDPHKDQFTPPSETEAPAPQPPRRGFFGGLTSLPRTLSNVQYRLGEGLVSFADRYYRPLMDFSIRQRYATCAFFLFFLVLSFTLAGTGFLKFAFSPEIEAELIQFEVDFPDGTPYARSKAVLERIEEAQKEVVAYFQPTPDAPSVIQHWFTWSREGAVTIWVLLAPPETRNTSAKEFSTKLREFIGEIPDAEEIELDFTINTPDTGIEFAVNAPDLDILRAAVEDLKQRLSTYGATYDIRDNLQSATPEIRLVLKPGAEQVGLTLGEMTRQVRQAYFGEEVQRLPREGNNVRVFVRYPRSARSNLDSLQNFRIRTTDGREIPLFAVADVEFAPGIKRINRRERQRSARVSAELTEDIASQIRQELDQDFFPAWEKRYPGVSVGLIGAAEGLAEFLSEISTLYLIAFMSMYAMLAVAFRSYWQPLLVMTAIPFGYMGAVYGHLAFGLTFALFSYFGVAAAAGVVVNDNLVLLDQVNRLRAQGASAMSALVEAGVSRFRPILLTSVTTFIGLMPMIAERSTQAEFLKPTVVALACGVAFAMFVTLFFVPALYAVGADISRFFRWSWTGEKQPRLDEATAVDADGPATL